MSANTPPPSAPIHVENSINNNNISSDSNQSSSSQLPRTPPKANKNRTCRNVIIHGFCKFEHSGCEFNHDLSNNKPSPGSPEIKSKLRVDSPVFNPSSFRPIESINVPSYLPNSSPTIQSQQNAYYVSVPTDKTYQCDINPQYDPAYGYYGNPAARVNPAQYIPAQVDMNSLANTMNSFNIGSPERVPTVPAISNINNFYQTNPILDSYYYNQQQPQPTQQAMNIKISPTQPLQYHLYTTPILPHGGQQNQGSIHSFFISDKLREELQKKNEAINQVIDITSPEYQNFPRELHVYHSFNIIDEHHEKTTKSFGYPTSIYKVISSIDGKAYALRRVEGYRLTNEVAMKSIENWRRIEHSNIVSLKEAFTTKAFGDHSLIFVYDYYPLSSTLESKYLSNQGSSISETKLWSIIIQISSALKVIHSAGLAARTLKANKILVTEKNRIRLNCCGMLDLLNYDGGKNYLHYQQEDLLHFGQLIVLLACGSNVPVHDLSSSMDYISKHYSPDIKSFIFGLLSNPNPMKNIDNIIAIIGTTRFLQEIENTNHYTDYLQNELGRELENGRLVRLLCKLGTINERPEFDMDPSWSETGDRYLLKLFRDYTFHQVDENGKPFVDIAHILQCLNKLDVGVDEKIMLMSRDEQSCLIVSYKELKQCVEQAFQDLRK